MTDNKENKKFNIRIFPIYKMLSWDLFFYYSIIFLYLIQVKNLTASQVILADTIYNIALMCFQLPAGKIVDILGKKRSVIIANICISIATFILLIMQSYAHLIIVYILQGFGYAIKGIAEDVILYNSLPEVKNKGKIFSKIDSRASSYYYYIDAISSLITGYLYIVNPYIPLILCLIFNIISVIVSFKLKSLNEVNKTTDESDSIKLIDVIKHTIKSNRLFCLVLFYAICSGLLYILTSLRSSIFEDLNLEAQYFGIIYAVLQITTGLAARFQNVIHNRFKNKTLSVMGIPLAVSCIIIGILGNFANNTKSAVFIIILIIFIIQGILKGAYKSLIVRYLNNFTNNKIRTKLKSVENLLYTIFAIAIGLISSAYLSITSTANTFIIIGCVTTILIVLLLDYMNGKVGLKPLEYTKEDIKYDTINIK